MRTIQRLSSPPPTRNRDDAIDTRRYLAALRRNVGLMLAVVVTITAAALVVSLVMAMTYEAQTQVIVPPTASGFAGADSDAAQRQLATVQTLVTSPTVLDAAAKDLGSTRDELEDDVTSVLDQNANIITIRAEADTAEGAARTADAVTAAFLANQSRVESESLRRAQSALDRQIEALQASPDASSPTIQGQVRALQQRAAELAVNQANAGSDLQIARGAEVPDAASSPRPVRNAVLAFFLAIFVAVLVALARDQLRPGVNGQRDVAEILGLPVLGTIPEKPGRLRSRRAPLLNRIEHESYRTLAASLRLQLGDREEQFITITSALHAEGKTSVSARLSRLLAESGRRTLVVSGDMRWPRLDGLFGLEGREGLGDLLALASAGAVGAEDLRRRIVPAANRQADVLPAGLILGDEAAALLTTENLSAVMLAISDLDYRYVVIDAPPMVGLGDAQVIASQTDEMLIVSRLKGLKLENLEALRLTLDRVHKDPIGVVVIGGPTTSSPYFGVPPGAPARATAGDRPDATLA